MAYDYANPFNLDYQGTWKPGATEPNFLGSNFGVLQELLKNNMQGDPNKGAYRNLFNKQIGKQSKSAIKNINEQLSSSGFRGSGANLIGDIFETQANATEGFENDLLTNDMNLKNNAIQQLLGLNQFEGGQQFNKFQSDRQQGQFDQSQAQQLRMFQEQLQYAKDSDPGWFEELLGGLLGAGGQIGAALLTGGSSPGMAGKAR